MAGDNPTEQQEEIATSITGKKEKKAKKKKKHKKKKSSKATKICHHEHEHEHEHGAPLAAAAVAAPVNAAATTTTTTTTTSNANNSQLSGGWASAFAAASKIQPTDDLGDTSTIDAYNDAGGEGGESNRNGVAGISQLAQEYTTTTTTTTTTTRKKSMCSDEVNATLKVAAAAATAATLKRKPKRKIAETSSNRSDGDDDDDNDDDVGALELAPSADKTLSQGATATTQSVPDFPYPTNSDDHCETPLQSYQDILPILNALSQRFTGGGKNMHSMRIYDPYYCNGSVVTHLSSLGFTHVYNKKEDCYTVWKGKSEPQYDALITNPPYSEDHIEKLMNYITSPTFDNKPWLLLMPTWVHKKEFYLNAISSNRKQQPCQPFYIVPKKRYVYLPPSNFRVKKESDTHKKSSPFVSMWYIWGGDMSTNEMLMKAFRQCNVALENCDLARSKNALRDLRRRGGSSSGGGDGGGGGGGRKESKKKKQKTGK